MSLVETSAALWRQRELLSMLLYKLQVESLVLASGRTRWLGTATHEVERVLARVREADVLRAVLVDTLVDELGLAPGASLAEIAEHVGEPWRDVFTEHRTALLAISAEISGAVRENRDRLTVGARAVRDALDAVGGDGSGPLYQANGSTVSAPVGARLVDEAL
ncbi:hypothetical protein GCM10022243_40950 [Saccharothrix violaceirubra]|uniref:FlgN protein n=1 Tax=Saccharothrix violaceirubra TaxID=413306 RepID=A0A7W7T8L9_9PSEU|nr:flagellar export chaperone FlgN [Saccharothrix violaceirubra]MBB4968351.1 hypothetical protein [Saccharothrix violaceirubra]